PGGGRRRGRGRRGRGRGRRGARRGGRVPARFAGAFPAFRRGRRGGVRGVRIVVGAGQGKSEGNADDDHEGQAHRADGDEQRRLGRIVAVARGSHGHIVTD